MTKHTKSSTRMEGVPDEKRRKTKIREPGQCFAKIKITYLGSQMVRIERYQDSPDHTHTIEESDMLKRSEAIKNMAIGEASKQYRPPAIVTAIKELASNQFGEGSGVEYLRRDEVANIQHKIRGPIMGHLVGDDDMEKDIHQAIKYLEEQEYQVEQFHLAGIITAVDSSSTSTSTESRKQGFSFARPEQLEKLTKYGWLTLFDSTHDTNKWRWRLFTLYIRDSVGCWDVGGHIFVSNEDSATVSTGLKLIRRMASRWQPRYMLCDQSSIEANGISVAFPGIRAGEQDCDVILCTVHTMRTWMKKIYHPPTRAKMILAMHKRTQIGCDMLIQEAIDTCSVEAVTQYIRRYCRNNTRKWALYARQHSPLLLQVTSTNALESYHSELKSIASITHGLIGMMVS